MRLLFLGPESGTSRQRANAFRRLGHAVRHVDDTAFAARARVASKFHYETGSLFLQKAVREAVLGAVGEETFDAVWVDHGRMVGPALVEAMRRRWGPVVNYNADDPYGFRDRYAWLTYRQAVPAYDLVVVVREPNVEEARALGARKVERIFRLADEVAHAPRELTPEQRAKYGADVSFIGTSFERRGAFLADLVERGVPLSLHGNGYRRTPQWSKIQPHWKGPGTTNDDDYAAAILAAKMALGLLSVKNRDEHTSRSAEIPYMGGLFFAKRTPEHLGMYADGKEAVFWDGAAECADLAHRLLREPSRLEDVAAAGRERALRNGYVNEPVLSRLLEIATR